MQVLHTNLHAVVLMREMQIQTGRTFQMVEPATMN